MSKDIKDEELYSQLYNIIQSAVRNEVERAMQEKDDKAQHDITQDNKITKASEKQVDSYIIGGETQEHAVTNQMGMLIGRDEPCFHCIDSNHNKDIWHVGVKNVSVAQTIEQFNSFYKFSMDKISELCS